MRTAILGYPDVEGRGPATLLFGSENGVDNNRMEFAQMKVSGDYPSGIVRIELWNDEARPLEVGISANPPKTISSKKGKKVNEKDSV